MLIVEVLQHHGLGVIALTPETPVSDAALLLSDQAIGAGVVIDESRGMAGIISERDIVRGLGLYGADVVGMRVSDLMTRDVVSCDPHSTVADALGTMQSLNVRHLPVVDGDNHLIGMVSMRDLVSLQPQPAHVLH